MGNLGIYHLLSPPPSSSRSILFSSLFSPPSLHPLSTFHSLFPLLLNPSSQALGDQLDWFNIVICRKKEKYKPKKAITAQAAYRPPSPMHPRPSTHASPSPSTPSHLTPPQTPQPPLSVTPPSPGATRRTVVSESSKSKKKKKEKEGKKKGGFFSNLKRRLKHGDKGNEGGDPGEGGVSGDPVVRGATATGGGKIAAPSSGQIL